MHNIAEYGINGMFENIHKNKRDLTALVCKPDKCASSTNNQCKYERIKL